MGRNSKEESIATRSEILQAATDMFWEKGVAGTSLVNIADKAGVTRGAIYWHFKNKCDIFSALYAQIHESFLETILADLEKDHDDPINQLKYLCIEVLNDIERNPQKKKILSILFLRCDYYGDMERFLTQQNKQKAVSAELFSRYFYRAIKKGYLDKHANPTIMTLALFSYITGIVFEHLRNPELIDIKTQAPELIEQFFKGITVLRA